MALQQLGSVHQAVDWLVLRGASALATDSRRVRPGDAFVVERVGLDAVGLDQASARAHRERGADVGPRVVRAAGPGDERLAGPDPAAVGGERRRAAQHQPVHCLADRSELLQRHQKLSTSAGISRATICGLTSRSGWTPIMRRVCCTTWLNTGAATSPP